MNTRLDIDTSARPARPVVLEPIEQVDLPALVYRVLRAKIYAGEFVPGAKLDLDLLEQGLRVSRTPINIALNRLSEEGLVTVVPRRGTFIRELTAADVAEIWDIRRALELLAAETGVGQVTDEALARSAGVLEQLATTHQSQDEGYVESATLDLQFHLGFLELAQNRRLVETYKGLHIDVINARLFYRGRVRPWSETDHDHRALLRAYEQRDVDSAKAAITAACENGKRALLQRIEDLGGVI